ncbi:MAG: TRAP transporter small permease [Desulfovibrio sp.]|jgi:TRAP-type C4-dicarboxylate transport system permease small subunit|nr:TRAP transporter small permease [Desulfovibrio sp.]
MSRQRGEGFPRRAGRPAMGASMSGVIVRWLDEWGEECFVSLMLSALILLLGVEVIMRAVFRHSFPWIDELCSYLFIWSSYIGVAIAMKRKEQLRVLCLMERVEKRFPRVGVTCYVISELTFTVFCCLVVYFSIEMLESMMQYTQVSGTLEINKIYVYLVIPISMVLTAFRTLQSLYRDYRSGNMRFKGRGD